MNLYSKAAYQRAAPSNLTFLPTQTTKFKGAIAELQRIISSQSTPSNPLNNSYTSNKLSQASNTRPLNYITNKCNDSTHNPSLNYTINGIAEAKKKLDISLQQINIDTSHPKHHVHLISQKLFRYNETKENNPNHFKLNNDANLMQKPLTFLRPTNFMDMKTVSGIYKKSHNYNIERVLGNGSFSVVYLGTEMYSRKVVAIKRYEKKNLTEIKVKSAQMEIYILSKLCHKNIVKFYEAFDTSEHVYIITEYINGQSLYSFVKNSKNKKISEDQAKPLIRQILEGLYYCHYHSYSHRDIKLENILIDQTGTVKIIDFGFAEYQPNHRKDRVFCGTPQYMAPEIIAKKEFNGQAADIWATGVLVYALLVGRLPFQGLNESEVFDSVLKNRMHYPESLSADAKEFIGEMLKQNASQRSEAVELLCNKWLTVNK